MLSACPTRRARTRARRRFLPFSTSYVSKDAPYSSTNDGREACASQTRAFAFSAGPDSLSRAEWPRVALALPFCRRCGAPSYRIRVTLGSRLQHSGPP
jgi:hypothetical protein